MTRWFKGKVEKPQDHPYLSGNFAPVHDELPLTSCSFTGTIPLELGGGQYIRNGGNTLLSEELGRNYHWFDGDGMLFGVLFQKSASNTENLEPYFVNQYILTDLYLSTVTSPALHSHAVPSISTLINPATTLLRMCLSILRTLFIVLLSHLPGSSHGIKRISVANTGLFYHDGRALATCESGPPIRVQLPNLETVGWYNGAYAEGERKGSVDPLAFGARGLFGFMNEWTTGHPKIDPITGDLILYHCTFTSPFVHYSIIPSEAALNAKEDTSRRVALTRVPVADVSGAKLMHDFGVSAKHTVLMDLPLSLDPFNLLRRKAVVTFDPASPTRFGVFPRYNPSEVRWYEANPCCIFHTANTWDELDPDGRCTSVNFLVCRLTSPAPIFVAGNVAMPGTNMPTPRISRLKWLLSLGRNNDDKAYVQMNKKNSQKSGIAASVSDDSFEEASNLESQVEESASRSTDDMSEEEQCRLFFYQFDLDRTDSNAINYQFALSSIPFEFPTVHPMKDMSAARYIYGCSTSTSSFNVALGRAVKIDTLVKVDALALIARGKEDAHSSGMGCVDDRTVNEIVADNITDLEDPIKCYRLPHGWYAQEARLVPRANAESEDDGYLLFYAFDESQLNKDGDCSDTAVSELWILNAKTMQDVVCRIRLPQRVPYGFHGNFFTERQIGQQREVSSVRKLRRKDPGPCRSLHDFFLRLAS